MGRRGPTKGRKKIKVVQQVANETGYFVPKYGQDTRPWAPDGRMKLGKKPRNIGPHTYPDAPKGLGKKPRRGAVGIDPAK